MNIAIRGIQDSGKTALMVGQIRQLLLNGAKYNEGYRSEDVYVNFKMYRLGGVHELNNSDMRKFIQSMISKQLSHKIIGITEADRVFPARFWNRPEQTDTLLGLWQDVKLFNMIFWDSHIGTSVDLLLRQTAQIEELPRYDVKNDSIGYWILNGIYQKVYYKVMNNVSREVFPYYDRWQPIN